MLPGEGQQVVSGVVEGDGVRPRPVRPTSQQGLSLHVAVRACVITPAVKRRLLHRDIDRPATRGAFVFRYSRCVLTLVVAVVAAQSEPPPDQLMRAAERTTRLTVRCRPGSEWWAANESNTDALASCERALRTLATETHTHAQATRERAEYLKARDLYRAYLNVFGPGPRLSDEAFNLTFYLAEVLWYLDSFEEAIAQYEAVVRFELPDTEGARLQAQPRYRQTAEFNIVLAWRQLVARERGRLPSPTTSTMSCDDGRVPPIGARRTPLSRFEAKLVRAADDYVLRHDEAAGSEVALDAALVFAERGHVSEALFRLKSLVARWPGETSARKAAAMIDRLQQPKR